MARQRSLSASRPCSERYSLLQGRPATASAKARHGRVNFRVLRRHDESCLRPSHQHRRLPHVGHHHGQPLGHIFQDRKGQALGDRVVRRISHSEDDIGSLGQVVRDKIRADVVLAVPTAVAGLHQNGSAAGIDAGLDVARRIAHQEAPGVIEAEPTPCLLEHPEVGLSALARTAVGGITVRMMRFRMMGAEVHGIEAGAGSLAKHFLQAGVEATDVVFRAQVTRHHRLVRNDDNEHTGVVESADGLGRSGDQNQLVLAPEEVHLLVDDAVTV